MRLLGRLVLCVSLGLIFFFSPRAVLATVTQDNDTGTYTDDLSSNSGIPTRSNMNVDTSDGKLKLTNAGGTFTAPYNTSGYVVTSTIIPLRVAKWATLSMTATTPTGTTITVQVADENGTLYSNADLSGNSSGFTTFPLDLSSLPIDRTATNGSGRIGRIKLKISFTTTDTNVTPDITGFVLSWDKTYGDVTATTPANTAWASPDLNNANTRRSSYYASTNYPAIRWLKSLNETYGGDIVRGKSNLIYTKTNGSYYGGFSTLYALNRDTGSTVWQRVIRGLLFQGNDLTLGENDSLYITDIYHDHQIAYNSDGTPKWLYSFGSGHNAQKGLIGSDGTIYTVYMGSGSTIFTVYAFNPDGSVKWTAVVDPPTSHAVDGAPGLALNDTALYYGFATRSGSNSTNEGRLYSFNLTNGNVNWSYDTGSVYTPVLGSDGTIYVGSYYTTAVLEKKVFAVNPDGSLKWVQSLGETDDYPIKTALSSTGLLYLGIQDAASTNHSLQVRRTSDGELVQTLNMTTDANSYLFLDSQDNLYRTSTGTTSYLRLYNSSYSQRWSISYSPANSSSFGQTIMDEDGRVYMTVHGSVVSSPYAASILAVFPWTLALNMDKTALKSGETVTFTATTAMPQTNPLHGGDNQVQVVADNGDKIILSYSSTNASGDTLWTGSYTIPSSWSDGSHSFTLEAAQPYVQTDTTTRFDSAPTSSNNTGVTTTGSLTVDNTGPVVSYTENGVTKKYEAAGEDNVFTTGSLSTFSFTKASDTTTSVAKYQIVIRDATGKEWVYIDNIEPTKPSDKNIREEEDKYTYYDGDYISVRARKDKDKLSTGAYRWRVRAIDEVGNSTDSNEKIIRVNTSQAIFSHSGNRFFPLTLLDISRGSNPIFYGITLTGARVKLRLEKVRTDGTLQYWGTYETTANTYSRFGINLFSLSAGKYFYSLSATIDGDFVEIPGGALVVSSDRSQATFDLAAAALAPSASLINPTIPLKPRPISEAKPEPKPRFCFLWWCW